MARVLTALEHEPIPITADGGGWSLTPAEADRLAQIGEIRPGFCEIGHRKVKLAQYCGVVGLGERVLEILPKTEDGSVTADECRGVLLRLLRLTERFPQFQHQPVGQHLRRVPLLEAFIAAFFDSVANVMRGGLLRRYEERAEDINVVRGRIAVPRQLGVLANRPDVVACVFDELTADNVWNRVLKKAIRVSRTWIRSVELNRRWVELMGVLDEVDDGRLTGVEVTRLTFDRQADRYRMAIDWARWILALLAPTLRGGKNEAPALLFDMNRLFESSIAVVLRRRAGAIAGLSVQAQDVSRTLGTVVWAGRTEPSYTLKPDLVVRSGADTLAIADTKWKVVERDLKGRLLPAQDDLYQMHAYAAAYQCTDLALIYPWRRELASAADTEFHLPEVNGRRPVVRVLCIDVQDDVLPLRLGGSAGAVGALLSGDALISQS